VKGEQGSGREVVGVADVRSNRAGQDDQEKLVLRVQHEERDALIAEGEAKIGGVIEQWKRGVNQQEVRVERGKAPVEKKSA